MELSMDHQSAAEAARRFAESLRTYTIPQFVAFYGVGRTRVFEEINSGRLKTYKVGRRRYISATAAAQWLADREAEAA